MGMNSQLSNASLEPATRTCHARARRLGGGLLASLLLGAFLPAQVPPVQAPPEVNIKIEGDEIALSVDETQGIAMVDFIKLTQQITGRVFVYTAQEVSNPTNTAITFVGPMRLKRKDFFSFFQTMLYIRNFALVLRATGDKEVVEIVQMSGPKRSELNASARYVPPDEIENYANQTGVTILTTVPLQYINANTAQTQLRPFFAQGGAGGIPAERDTARHPCSNGARPS